ncbi:MAG TPA: hypothetical protein VGV39_09255 [Mesorhizobium sp.]|uniref:hypothetical protein n=1 Tax=Mesorhizobium sp. TaxID=1871066 RepID=UPI002DDCE433|nr:hypothetical protein [Mesorhizobium sp.]HEV2503252.1 hypothetical protein [Mesorhizobium sp.]
MLPTVSMKAARHSRVWRSHDLMIVRPDCLDRTAPRYETNRQATLLEEARHMPCSSDRFIGLPSEPANAVQGTATAEVQGSPWRDRQMLSKPFPMIIDPVDHPLRAIQFQKPKIGLENAGLDTRVAVDERRNKPHIHDDCRLQPKHRQSSDFRIAGQSAAARINRSSCPEARNA